MAENTPRCLIPVYESQLTACLVEQDGLDHAISAARVCNSAIEREEPEGNHDRQHDRVSAIERIFLYEHR